MRHVEGYWLEPVLELALRAPSAGNGQPWSLAWDGENLEIRVDPERVPMGDAHLSRLQLGCLIESLDLAARHADRGIECELPSAPRGPAAIVRFRSGVAPSPLASMLARRVTDRRLHAGGRLPCELLRELERGDDGSALHILEGCPESLIDHLAEWEALWIEWPRLTSSAMLRWARWSREDARRTRDGAHWANLGMPYPVSRVFKLAQREPAVMDGLRALGLARGVMHTARRRLRSSAGVALVTTRAATNEAALHAGRRFVRSWLMLQHRGFAVHPMNLAASSLAQAALGLEVPLDAPPQLSRLVREGNALFESLFGLDRDEAPAFFFRFGAAPGPFPVHQRTLRRPLIDVLTRR